MNGAEQMQVEGRDEAAGAAEGSRQSSVAKRNAGRELMRCPTAAGAPDCASVGWSRVWNSVEMVPLSEGLTSMFKYVYQPTVEGYFYSSYVRYCQIDCQSSQEKTQKEKR